MSDILILGGQKVEKFKETKWVMFCGTPCIMRLPIRQFVHDVRPAVVHCQWEGGAGHGGHHHQQGQQGDHGG